MRQAVAQCLHVTFGHPGLSPTVLKCGVNYAIRFPVYLNVKDWLLQRHEDKHELNFFEALFSGGIAGTFLPVKQEGD